MSEREITVIVNIDDCENIAAAWIRNNLVDALDLMPLNKLVDQVIDNIDDITGDELEKLETAIRAEQFKRGDGNEF